MLKSNTPDDAKRCDKCIHRKVCLARSSIDAVSKEWNRQYPFVPMIANGDSIAEMCTEYKTLSDIHIINKEGNDKQ